MKITLFTFSKFQLCLHCQPKMLSSVFLSSNGSFGFFFSSRCFTGCLFANIDYRFDNAWLVKLYWLDVEASQ